MGGMGNSISTMPTNTNSGTSGVLNLPPKKSPTIAKPRWHAPWKLYRVISGHLGWVRCCAIEPGNDWFATGSADRVIKVIRLENRRYFHSHRSYPNDFSHRFGTWQVESWRYRSLDTSAAFVASPYPIDIRICSHAVKIVKSNAGTLSTTRSYSQTRETSGISNFREWK